MDFERIERISEAAKNGDFMPTVHFFNDEFEEAGNDEMRMLSGMEHIEKLFGSIKPTHALEILPYVKSNALKGAILKAAGSRLIADAASDCLKNLLTESPLFGGRISMMFWLIKKNRNRYLRFDLVTSDKARVEKSHRCTVVGMKLD